MKYRIIVYQLLIYIVLYVFNACSNENGLFYTIEESQKLINESRTTKLGNANITSMARLGNTYYLTTSVLYKRTVDASSSSDAGKWHLDGITLPAPYSGVAKIYSDNTHLFAYLYSTDGISRGLFYSTELVQVWNEVPNITQSTEILDNFFYVNNTFFYLTKKKSGSGVTSSFVYTLKYNTNTVATSDKNIKPIVQTSSQFIDYNLPIKQIVFDGTYYWFITAQQLYRMDAVHYTILLVENFNQTFTYGTIQALIANQHSILVSTNIGYVIELQDIQINTSSGALDAQSIQVSEQVKNGSVIVPMGTFLMPVGNAKEYRVAALSQGYYIIILDTINKGKPILKRPSANNGNILSSDIYQGSINDFYIDIDDDTVFLLTLRNKILRGTYSIEKNGWMWKLE